VGSAGGDILTRRMDRVMSTDLTPDEIERLMKRVKLPPKPAKPVPWGVSFHLLIFSWWEGDIGFSVAEIETWNTSGSLLSIWYSDYWQIDLFYINYWKRLIEAVGAWLGASWG
jgi:hypothetical protein